jgi:hypothetical protein
VEALARVVGLAPAPAPDWVADVAPAPGNTGSGGRVPLRVFAQGAKPG